MDGEGNNTDLQRVWSLFEVAADLDPEAQRTFLEAIGTRDNELRRRLEGMLRVDLRSETFLDRPAIAGGGLTEAATPGGDVASAEPDSASAGPTMIGPYRIVRRIGHGGMSTVYLATRADADFVREVVIKVVRHDLDNPVLAARLRAERKILAGLRHPNIARLYDVGTTEDGSPFLVMEYIEGSALTRHCADHALSIDQRLALLGKVAEAVSYAHRNLVVHRDLKPSNILVRASGEPVLLDFGIAKLLTDEAPMAGGDQTAPWHRALTPGYASPEQMRGGRTTTASDVYSLGVLLYEVLTGRLPFDLAGRSQREAEDLVTDTVPLAPSAVAGSATGMTALREAGFHASGSRHSHRLAGDIDAIILKALRATPEDRYGSVEQLAADLDRHHRGLPVLARRGTFRYRAGRFLRRNRARVGVALAFAIVLVGFAVSMAWQAARTARERDQARLERDKKDQVVSLVQDVFSLSSPYVVPGTDLTVREALERSVPLVERRLGDQPAVLAEMLDTAGSIYASIGQFEAARRQLEHSLRLHRALGGEPRREVVEVQARLASVLAALGDERAIEMAQEAVDAARGLPEAPGLLLEALNSLVLAMCCGERNDAAAALAEEAAALAERTPVSVDQKIQALEHRGPVETTAGRYAEAESLYRRALALRRERYGDDHPSQIHALNNLGVVLRRLGRLDEAEATLRQVIALERFNYGDDFADPVNYMNLAGVEIARRRPERAIEHLEQALDVVGGPGSDHRHTLRIELALASARADAGEAAVVESELRRLVEALEVARGADHWLVAWARNILGNSLSAQGRFAEAEPLLVDSFERLVEIARARHQRDAFERLARHLERVGRGAEIARYEAMLEDG